MANNVETRGYMEQIAELRQELASLRTALQKKDEAIDIQVRLRMQEQMEQIAGRDEAIKKYIAEEVKRQVDARFEAYNRLLGMQVPTPVNRFYK
jgi:hypothetical protein